MPNFFFITDSCEHHSSIRWNEGWFQVIYHSMPATVASHLASISNITFKGFSCFDNTVTHRIFFQMATMSSRRKKVCAVFRPVPLVNKCHNSSCSAIPFPGAFDPLVLQVLQFGKHWCQQALLHLQVWV